MRWQEAEKEVRKIAESVWSAKAEPEDVAGVRCDCVLKVRGDYWVLIEISKRDDLNKMRDDAAKLSAMKQSLIGKGIYGECYFVTLGDHTSLRATAQALNIEIHNLYTFASKYIGSSQYLTERVKSPFGSAVHPDTGQVDEKSYAPIHYIDEDGKKHSIHSIAEALKSGRIIVLMGEFGSGKSRCIMEVFRTLSQEVGQFPPIAINLRDNWGYKKLHHITSNHLDSLGLGQYTDNVVRSLRSGNHVILLDGFDEIGSQAWSGDPRRLMETRKRSLEGVRDLIANCSDSGVLIAGREHYFSTNEEMKECLGIGKSNALILKCPDEFTESELKDYLETNSVLVSVPTWMPRKPLICQLLSRLSAEEVQQLEIAAEGELNFFESVFDSICARETKINPSMFKDTLKDILLTLAQKTREKPITSETITTEEINQAFFTVTGSAPVDESAQLLQRLPYLGRTGTGGTDRMFIDDYAKDGLRGLALAKSAQSSNKETLNQRWIQPIGELGLRIFAKTTNLDHETERYAKQSSNRVNHQVGCDYVAAKLIQGLDEVDFQGLSLSDGKFSTLQFAETTIKNLNLSAMEIGELIIEDAKFQSVCISDSIIDTLKGTSNLSGFSDIFLNCEFEKSEEATSSARISELHLNNSEKTLLAIIKKLFFQKGAGRREEALLRGAEKYWDKQAAEKIIAYLESNKIITTSKGDHGKLYHPQRKFAMRMNHILKMQSNSNDELWNLAK